jgi:hypothetical protein
VCHPAGFRFLIRDRDHKFTAPQPVHEPRRTRRPRSTPSSYVPTSASSAPRSGHPGERDQGTLHRNPAPGMPRPPSDHWTTSPRHRAARVRAALQHAPISPISGPASARMRHPARFRRGHPRPPTRSPRRPLTRVRPGRMMWQGSRHPQDPWRNQAALAPYERTHAVRRQHLVARR